MPSSRLPHEAAVETGTAAHALDDATLLYFGRHGREAGAILYWLASTAGYCLAPRTDR